MSNTNKFSFNPLSMFRKVVDEQIESRYTSREEVKKGSQILLIVVAAAAAFVVNKMVTDGISLKASWLPLTIIAALGYVVWRMHAVWVYGTIVEMANDEDKEKPENEDDR